MKKWIADEIAGCEFANLRIRKRFKVLVSSLSNGLDGTIPFAWENYPDNVGYLDAFD